MMTAIQYRTSMPDGGCTTATFFDRRRAASFLWRLRHAGGRACRVNDAEVVVPMQVLAKESRRHY